MAFTPLMRDIGVISTVGDATPPSTYRVHAYGNDPVRMRVIKGRSKEIKDGSQTVVTDTEIHLPIDTVVTALNRIKVTTFNRAVLGTSEYYAIKEEPDDGEKYTRGVIICRCVKLTGESVR